ncbi:MAG TPA: hypothetical protein VFB45_09770 [Pseudolabrys sp.]|nr:hypothetical protein [Pseudolabrys sp.]
MSKWETVKDIVLFLVALYGAALSTFNWRQAVRKDRRQVKVQASTAMPTYGASLGPPFAKIEAINAGQRVVNVEKITFELPNGTRLYPMSADQFPGQPDTRFPATLADGQNAFDDAVLRHRPGASPKRQFTQSEAYAGVHRHNG